jgi:hypothetical protein
MKESLDFNEKIKRLEEEREREIKQNLTLRKEDEN